MSYWASQTTEKVVVVNVAAEAVEMVIEGQDVEAIMMEDVVGQEVEVVMMEDMVEGRVSEVVAKVTM
eukprot:7999394-Ditylum_brightwellii.AAC.1